jgi:hypothetical protein
MHGGGILVTIEAAPGMARGRLACASYMPGQFPWACVPDGAVVDGVVVVEGVVAVPVSGAVAVAVDGVVVVLEPVVAA